MKTNVSVKVINSDCCVCASSQFSQVGSGVDFEYHTCDNSFQIVRCKGCGHHYLNPLPAPSELTTIYPVNYGNYSFSAKKSLAFRVKNWLDYRSLRPILRKITPGASVLDIGCGDGRLLDIIRENFRNIFNFHGVEISKYAAELACQKGYKVFIGTFETLEIPQNSYDVIFLQQVLEHLYSPRLAIQKIHNSLKKGGIMVLETPSVESLDFKLFYKRYWGGYHIPRHFNLFDEKNLSILVEAYGFSVLKVKYKPQPVHWIWSLHHYFYERNYPNWWVDMFHIKNTILLGFFTCIELVVLLVGGKTSNMQIVAQK